MKDASGKLHCPSRGFVRGWSAEEPLPTIEQLDYRGVVLPQIAAPAMLCQCSRRTLGLPDAYWTPTAQDIAELEKCLPRYVAEHPPQPDFWQRYKPQEYVRKYLGVVRADRRRIAVELTYDAKHHVDLAHPSVGPRCDHGPRYFGVEYDLEDAAFVLIAFDGTG